MDGIIRNYQGRNFPMPEKARKGAYELSSRTSLTIYAEGSVDAVFFDEMILLCSETAEYLYSEYTPTIVSYSRGSRPFLEEIVDHVTYGKEDPTEKFFSLLEYVRDIRKRDPVPDDILRLGPDDERTPDATGLFYGGTEEEIIKKGSDMCNEMARVLVILSQIAGIPARYIGHICSFSEDLKVRYPAGHGVLEAYLNEKWAYVDIRGHHFYKTDGNLASTWEIMNDPSIIDKQPESVVKMLKKGYDFSSTHAYFAPGTMTFILNYPVSDFGKYKYPWTWNGKDLRERVKIFNSTLYKKILDDLKK